MAVPERPASPRVQVALVAAAMIVVAFWAGGGCHWGAAPPPPPPGAEAPHVPASGGEDVVAQAPSPDAAVEGESPETPAAVQAEVPGDELPAWETGHAPAAGAPQDEAATTETAPVPPEGSAGGAREGEGAAPTRPVESGAAHGKPSAAAPARGQAAGGGPSRLVVARLPETQAFAQDGPPWARSREELAYKIDFLGMTMGYARFSFDGKVLLGGKEAYHIRVRAWTTGVLSMLYPINDVIDYYVDAVTLFPLRQDYFRGDGKKNAVALYDQERGKVVYRNRSTGEITRQVDVVPGVHDPVTVAYFYRARDFGNGDSGRKIYTGRKIWEIVPQPLGTERIHTEAGDVDTLVVRPVILRDGQVQDKGDMKMWVTRDERRVPVRFYAKFRKVRTWTLVGELLPGREGG